MRTLEIGKPDQVVKAIGQKCFGYRGRRFRISTSIPSEIRSYWDGGSKSSYAFYNLSSKEVKSVPTNHPMFDKGVPSKVGVLPEGFALVEHNIFCGKDMGITIYVNEENMTKMVEQEQVELGRNEKIVLAATRSLKSSYGGVKNLRYVEAHRITGITTEEWEKAKASLIKLKLLNKAGAITANGRNAIGYTDLYKLK